MPFEKKITTRPLKTTDGIKLWRLAQSTHSLDLNSPYHYLLFCHHFSETSIAVECDGILAGFATGYFPPGRSDTLFIWQVAVETEARGRGIATKMLLDLVNRKYDHGIMYIEATISPSNAGSQALFTSVARKLNAPVEYATVVFSESAFDGLDHEAEILFRIGPIPPI